MYRRILVPTDGGSCSDEASKHAVAIAKALGSNVVFLFVMDTLRNYHEGVMAEVRQRLADEGTASLARARKIAIDACLDAEVELAEGDPAHVILRVGEDFDLIVMGSHGKGLWKRLTVGSVTEAVLRRATRPLLLIRCAGDGARPATYG